MKTTIIICVLLPVITDAGQINLTGGLSAYQPVESDAGTTPIYFVGVTYWINDFLNADYKISYARYKSRGITFHYIPHKLGVEGHIPIHRLFDPYVGTGFVYSHKKFGRDGFLDTIGYSGKLGVNVLLTKNTYIGGYIEIVVPDYRDSSRRSLQYGIKFPGLSFSW
ncbi:MAG: porin family protein [bacterium]|nr:porin family protein [bacterium]